MYLHDSLQICLLALASRYPDHIIDINEAVLGRQMFGCQGWTADEVIALFKDQAPHLLHKKARMMIDQCRCVIHLPEYSEEQPAFWLHCRGKLPPRHREDMRELAHG
jgi:hypothetical protein